MKMERLLSIIMLLLDKQVISANTLANTFEVSKRTIYRDIDTLIYAGFPIISYPGINGGFGLLDHFKLHSFTFSDQEKQEIRSALHMQEQLLPQQNACTHIDQKLQLITDSPITPHRMTFTSATLHHPAIEKETNKKLQQLYAALHNHQKTRINYIDANGNVSQRIMYPLEFILQNGSWYVKGYCEVRSDIRLFKITRIRHIEVLKIPFTDCVLDHEAINVHQKEVQLSFTKQLLGKLYDFFLDEQMEVKENYVIVTFHYEQTQSIIPFLMMFGNQVNVIYPEALKRQHIQAIHDLQNLYENEECCHNGVIIPMV